MTVLKPSELAMEEKRQRGKEWSYAPSGYLRINDEGKLQQLWYSLSGFGVWESVQKGNISPKQAALGAASEGRNTDLDRK